MNKENQKKIDALSKKLKAIDEQEAKTHPAEGTRRWFFRALTFGLGGAVLGKTVVANAMPGYCFTSNRPCDMDTCGPDGNICRNKNMCSINNICHEYNACTEINECSDNTCENKNICHSWNMCTTPDGGSGCTIHNKCSIYNGSLK